MSKMSNYQAQKSGIFRNNPKTEKLSGFICAYTHIQRVWPLQNSDIIWLACENSLGLAK
jgi:hypothetical protein